MNSLGKAAQLGARLLRIILVNPSRLRHVLGVALAVSEEVEDPSRDLLRFPAVNPEELLPEKREHAATLTLFPKTYASLSPLESVSLLLLLKKARAVNVFEFGTYKGVSTTQLVLNLPPEGRVFTLDLPDEESNIRFAIPDPEERRIARESGKGSLVPDELRTRIEFLKHDSATFDETPYLEKMDLVFVDGAHSADYVRSDSEKGWRMLRKGGIMAWHDCRVADPDVVRYLLQCPFGPTRIAGTSLAFATKP